MVDKIDWLFFDLGTTLIDESKAINHRILNTIKDTNISYTDFYETMINYYKYSEDGYKLTVDYFGLVKSKWFSEDELLYLETLEYLRKLHLKYKIGIIANQSLNVEDRLKTLGIFDCFDLIISSANVKVSKPDSRIFEMALEKASCHPENALMIGDRIDNDILPAIKLGMKTIWLRQGFAQYLQVNDSVIADYTLNNIREVYDLLK